jgi:hypothetical protein
MAARTSLLRDNSPQTRVPFADSSGLLTRASTAVWFRLLATAASRRTRARLGMLTVPLAITASLITGQWWAVLPLCVCAWWWVPQHTGWEWLGAVGRGLIGAEWVLIGSSALAAFPTARTVVEVSWVLSVLILALASKVDSQ